MQRTRHGSYTPATTGLLSLLAVPALLMSASSCGGPPRATPSGGSGGNAGPGNSDVAVRVPATFEIHGHRGARGRYPENTIEGLVATLRDGVDVLETDLLLTRDGVLVLHHDYDLNPDTTRNASGRWLEKRGAPLLAMTVAELAQYDVGRLRPGSDYGAKYPEQRGQDGVRIPTLAAALTALDQASGGRAKWNLEIKIATEHPELTASPEAAADATLAMLRERGLTTRTMIQSFDWRAVRRVHEVAPEISTGCLTSAHTVAPTAGGPSPYLAGLDLATHGNSVPRLVHAAGCKYWTPDFATLDAANVAEAHRLGLRVVPWTVNKPDDLRRIVGLGVDGLITDYPDRIARQPM